MKAGSTLVGQYTVARGRSTVPSEEMVVRCGVLVRDAMLIIRSLCADGAPVTGARPGEKSSCPAPIRTALAFPMPEPLVQTTHGQRHGRTSSRDGTDPPPMVCLVIAGSPGVSIPPLQARAHRRPGRPNASTGHEKHEAIRHNPQ